MREDQKGTIGREPPSRAKKSAPLPKDGPRSPRSRAAARDVAGGSPDLAWVPEAPIRMDRAIPGLRPEELIVDSFAGGGGASLGISKALGREPDYAVNHSASALSMHAVNHVDTIHLPHDVWKVRPQDLTKGRPVGVLWASPDCRSHSRAKGGKPRSQKIRDLAWVVVRWAKAVRPRIIMLENVSEFMDWGSLLPDGQPNPRTKGQTFADFVGRLERKGYRVEYRMLRACDYGAPTIRNRLFLVARCDDLPIVWPAKTHGDPASAEVRSGQLKPWPFAADQIDWDIRCPSIFLSREEGREVKANRPLADNTMARVAKGVKRFVLDAKAPFLVSLTHQGGDRIESLDGPFRTITGANRGEKALVSLTTSEGGARGAPFITKFRQGAVGSSIESPFPTVTANSFDKRPGGAAPLGVVAPRLSPIADVVAPVMTYAQQGGMVRDAGCPMHTITASNKDQNSIIAPKFAGVTREGGDACYAPYFVPRYGERPGQEPRTYAPDRPGPTIVPTGNGGSLAAVSVIRHFGGSVGSPADAPVGATTAGGGGKTGVVQTEVATFVAQNNEGNVGHAATEPFSTIVGKGCTQSPVAVHLTRFNQNGTGSAADEPLDTVMAGATRHGVVAAALIQNMKGTDQRASDAGAPMPSVTSQGNHLGAVEATVAEVRESDVCDAARMTAAAIASLTPAQLEGARQVAEFLRDHGCWDGGEVVVIKDSLILVDIGLRMLRPRELARAQGFPDDYVLDPIHEGRPLTATDQVRMIGNSVCPQVAQALAYANVVEAAQMTNVVNYRAWGAALKQRLIGLQEQRRMVQTSLFDDEAA